MIRIREAGIEENNGLLLLTSLTPMEGRISLLTDRRPDFFSLCRLRGPGKVFIAEKDREIIGSFSVSIVNMVICGKSEKVYYLADLKIHPDYFGKTIAVRLLHHMHHYLGEIGADLLFSTAAYGNSKVIPLFEGRAGFPPFHCAGIFNGYQIIPVKRSLSQDSFEIREISSNPDLINFYREFYNRYRFTPVISEQYLKDTSTLVVLSNGIKASISLIDVSDYKQNVLIHLPLILKVVVFALRQLNRVLRIFNIPVPGEPIKIIYIRAFAFSKGNEKLLHALIQHARNQCCIKKYCFLSIALHEKDPMNEFFRKYLHFNYRSLGFLTSLSKNTQITTNILSGPIFEDYSIV